MRNSILTTYFAMFALVAQLSAQQRFESADAAAQALLDGAAKHDGTQLAVIFGPKGNAIMTSGNAARDRAEQSAFSQLAETKHQLIVDPRNSNRVILSIGNEDWPFPVPIVASNGKWSFDASETKIEMKARRIGTNELDVIEICAGYVEAQKKYASDNRAKHGLFQYASQMTGTSNGTGLGPLVSLGLANATRDGQKKALTPYHGYFFRILDGQGPHAPGGTHNYSVKSKLMGGFGLVAWPAQYGVTGILTFIVNQEGQIYQKDVAPKPDGAAATITSYDPDPTWKRVD